MGLWPTYRNESGTFVTPAQAGVHLGRLDSRFRGNDVTFDGARAVFKLRQSPKGNG
jgi:hypothetical protein